MNFGAIDGFRARILAAMAALGQEYQEYIVESLSTPGSVVPFVASRPGSPSFNWDDELTSGISHTVEDAGDVVTLRMVSAGVSKYSQPGKIIAADAEFGHWWNGWAYDSRGGKWVKCAEPHQVAPRPHMQPAMDFAEEDCLERLPELMR